RWRLGGGLLSPLSARRPRVPYLNVIPFLEPDMTEEEKVFAGGVAVITGAGAGIGMGIARRCGEIGMAVVVTDADKDRADKVAAEIVAKSGKAEAIALDVSRPEALDALAQDIFDRYGAVRLLVNNAGIETIGHVWEIPTARW